MRAPRTRATSCPCCTAWWPTSRPWSRSPRRRRRSREPPHQAASAALQHQAARRQGVPLAPARAARRVAPAHRRAHPRRRRRALLRAVPFGHRREAHAPPRQQTLPAPHVHRRRPRLARRPCLQHQIKRCPAPCVFEVDRAFYAEQVRAVALFLEGRHDELSSELQQRMGEAAAALLSPPPCTATSSTRFPRCVRSSGWSRSSAARATCSGSTARATSSSSRCSTSATASSRGWRPSAYAARRCRTKRSSRRSFLAALLAPRPARRRGAEGASPGGRARA